MCRINKRILVVDDEQDSSMAFKLVLENHGFNVDYYTNQVIALKNFKPDLYGLIILDIKMPDINGFELYRCLKSIDTRVKTLFITALSNVEPYNLKKKVYPKEGETYFATKPIGNHDLLELVNLITN